jgi:hypothetical protein
VVLWIKYTWTRFVYVHDKEKDGDTGWIISN